MVPRFVRHALGAVERQEERAERVDRRQKRDDQQPPDRQPIRTGAVHPGLRACTAAMIASLLQKPANGTTPARARQPNRNVQCVIGISRRKPPKRRMSITPPMACITLPAPEEQQGLEKGVREQVEHAGRDARQRAGAQAQEHVAQLADRRIGQHALQIGLRHGDHAAQGGGREADQGYNVLGIGRNHEQRRAAGDHVDAGRDHRGGVDQAR